MKKLEKAKILFEKYLKREASSEELEEMFHLLRNRSVFEALHGLFEQEWDSEDVTFLLDDMSWEEMQNDWHESQISNLPRKEIRTLTVFKVLKRVAAAAIVLLLVGLSIWLTMRPVNKVFETGYGETLEIVLEDESRVTLNANSKLIWYSNWRNKKERRVELEGEAFFEVNRHQLNFGEYSEESDKRNQFMAFKVITPDLTVNVLGTSFNVLARRLKTDVFLRTGEVLLTKNDSEDLNPRRDNTNTKNKIVKSDPDSIYLVPGDHVSYSGITGIVERYHDQSSQDQTSWIDGFLVYDNDPLRTVLQDLEDIYGKDFQVSDSALLDREVNLGLPYENWETVSGLMTLSLEIEMIETENYIIVRRKQGK